MKPLERQLLDYCEYQSGLHGPVSVDEITTRPLRLAEPPRTGLKRPVWVAIAAATAALVLVGGVAWIALLRTSPDPPVVTQVPEPTVTVPEPTVTVPEPTVTVPVDETIPEESPDEARVEEPQTPPDGLPSGADWGTVDTPLGTATWVHVTGDPGTLPGEGEVVAWPSGFALFESPSRFWISDDGFDWRLDPLAVPPTAEDAMFSLSGGLYWLISSDGFWRSSDGADWDQLDPDGLAPPAPPELFEEAGYGRPVTGGGVTVSHAYFGWSLDVTEYLPLLIDGYDPGGDDDDCRALLELAPTVFQVVGGHSGQEEPPCPHEITLRFEETETGIRVLDDATGLELDHIQGVDLGHIERLARVGDGDGVVEGRLLIIEGNAMTQIEVPWSGHLLTFFGTDDSVFAYVEDAVTHQVDAWRTTDGHTWTNVGPQPFTSDSRWRSVPGRLVVTVEERSNVARCASEGLRCSVFVTSWETSDGMIWTPVPLEGRPDPSWPIRVESGWFANDGPRGNNTEGNWWMLTEDAWVSLADLRISEASAPDSFRCGVQVDAVGPTTFFRRGSGPGCATTDVWVLSPNP